MQAEARAGDHSSRLEAPYLCLAVSPSDCTLGFLHLPSTLSILFLLHLLSLLYYLHSLLPSLYLNCRPVRHSARRISILAYQHCR